MNGKFINVAFNKRDMEKDIILETLNDWNFWNKDLQTGIKRMGYIERLESMAKTNQVIVVMGARRSGKSFLLRQFAKNLIEKGNEKNRTLFINCEDPRFGIMSTKELQFIYEAYLENLNPKGSPWIIIDEIQEIEGWEKWVRTMHELGKAKIIISGSNAKLLGTELSTLLTGRHINLEVYPLSFKEFLMFREIEIKNRFDAASKKIELERLLMEYFEFGGFPEAVCGNEKKLILLEYFNDMLKKDLINRYKIRKSRRLLELAKYYLSNIACPITYNSIEKSLGISADTAEKFSTYLEEGNIVFFLKRFSFKVKEQDKSPKKVYSVDCGLANAVGFRFRENMGHLAENIVFLGLKRMASKDPNIEIFYWKNNLQYETDFIVKEGLKIKTAIQVCWDVAKKETKEREIRALLSAMDELKISEGMIITKDFRDEETIHGKKIEYLPIMDWLLEFK